MTEERDPFEGTLFSSKVYFRPDSFVFKFLRLFNLMEPDRNVISISKSMMWAVMSVMVYTLLFRYDNLVAILSAITALIPVLANYAFRRVTQKKSDSGEVVPSSEDEDDGKN